MNDDKRDDEITPQQAKKNEEFQKTCGELRESLADANRLVQHLRDLETVVRVGEDQDCNLRVTVNGIDTRESGFGLERNVFAWEEPDDDEGGRTMILPGRFIG